MIKPLNGGSFFKYAMHLELTSRCTLACPACPRTWFADKFNMPFPKQDLDLDTLSYFLDCNTGQTVDTLFLCGNHGDPIYYPRLFELIDRFRSTKKFIIVTNGSFQTPNFWNTLANKLTNNDSIVFSIDGLEHNNHLYRKNSNWQSLMTGLDIMLASNVPVTWKTLVFSYNQHEIQAIKEFAVGKGCSFSAMLSSRFSDDSFVPESQYVDSSRLYSKYESVELTPRCQSQEYISADGYYWPCCMISSYFTLHKTVLWKQRNNWAIAGKKLDALRPILSNWQQGVINDPNNAHDVCKMECKSNQNTHTRLLT